ncbi:MAG: hypothetical protein AABZ44_07160 [Elusimicrobiota bacterium]
MGCGKTTGVPQSVRPGMPSWGNISIFSGLFLLAMVGNYFNPMVEATIIAFFAVILTTGWVYADSQKYRMNHVLWTLSNLFLWAFSFPLYLWKTRSLQGFLPGLIVVIAVIGLQVMPPMYSAAKHFKRGVRYARQQMTTLAEQEFKSAIAKQSGMGEAYLNLGSLYLSQGFLDAAEKELLVAKEKIDLNGVKLLQNLNREQAMSLCLSHLAAVYIARTSEAIQVLDRNEARLHFDKAKEFVDAANNFDPGNVRSQELDRRLKQLSTFLE